LVGAALPVVRNRCDHFTTLAGLMLKAAATARTLSPFRTRPTARSRKSIDNGFAIHAGLLPPASMLNQINRDSRIPFDSTSHHPALEHYAPKWNRFGDHIMRLFNKLSMILSKKW